MIKKYYKGSFDRILIKHLKRAIFESEQSKAINKKIGACLVPEYGEVPIGGYNGPPRGIPEMDNWDRFDEETYHRLWNIADEKYGFEERDNSDVPETGFYAIPIDLGSKRESIYVPPRRSKAHPRVKHDPRYLLGYTSGNGLKYMIDSHAERNAIFNAARSGVPTINASLYLTCEIPCKECTIAILQAGIKNVFAVESDKHNDSEYAFGLSRWFYKTSPYVTLFEYPMSYLEKAKNG